MVQLINVGALTESATAQLISQISPHTGGPESLPAPTNSVAPAGAPERILVATPSEGGSSSSESIVSQGPPSESGGKTVKWQQTTPGYDSTLGRAAAHVDATVGAPVRSALNNDREVTAGQVALGLGGVGIEPRELLGKSLDEMNITRVEGFVNGKVNGQDTKIHLEFRNNQAVLEKTIIKTQQH